MHPTDPTRPGTPLDPTLAGQTTDPTRSGQTTATPHSGQAALNPAPYSYYPEGCSVKEDLLNRDIYNELDEKIGDLRDVVLGADGRAHYYIVGVGGFLGLGEHDVRISCEHIEHTADRFILRGYTKDQLKELPSTHHLRQI